MQHGERSETNMAWRGSAVDHRFIRHFITIAAIGVVFLVASALLHVNARDELHCISRALRGC